MTEIHVKPTESGWTVTRGKDTFTVKDNGDGVIGKGDTWKGTSLGKTLSQDEMFEAYGLSLVKEEMTTEDMIKYNQYQKQMNARKAAKEKAEQYNDPKREQILQQAIYGNPSNSQPVSKKKNFWSKFAMGSMIGLTALNVVTPFIFRPWQSNGNNFFDLQGTMFTSMTNLMTGMTGIMMANYSSKANLSMQMPQTATAPGGINQNAFMDAMNAYNEQQKLRDEELNTLMQTSAQERKIKQQEQQKKAFNEKVASDMKQTFVDSQNNDLPFYPSNRDYMKQIYQVGKEEYTEEEIKNVEMLTKYKMLPFESISKTGEKGKLNEKTAAELNKLLNEYQLSENKEDIMDADTYVLVTETLLPKAKEGRLTETNIAALNDIIKDALVKIENSKKKK